MKQGTLFGVSVGPGDPELLTLKAVKTIERCPVLAAPVTADGKTLALEIAAGAVDLTGKTILPLALSMTKDEEKRRAEYAAAAQALADHLAAGEDVAVLNLGDVSVFASFPYLAAPLREQGFEVEMIPGVTSFSAAACALGVSLTERDRGLSILSGRDDLESRLDLPGTKVLMKSGKSLPGVLETLKNRRLLGKSLLAVNCGLPGEALYSDLSTLPEAFDSGYFTLIIVKE